MSILCCSFESVNTRTERMFESSGVLATSSLSFVLALLSLSFVLALLSLPFVFVPSVQLEN